jgi:diadenosine tetraphosphatase ApaH/serine/threonine PP2A family protein phosphatase
MRYLVLSDIHANIDALEAVLTAAAARGYDEVLLLGDLVGYGATPDAVIERVRALNPAAAIRGNHDKAATGQGGAENFNPLAKQAAHWTRSAITPANLAYLAELPRGPLPVTDEIEICHGTPADEDAYVFDGLDAVRAINAASRPICLFGHTHIPLIVALEDGALEYDDVVDGQVLELRPGARYLINAGSVGQPRDGNPAASFAILDTASRQMTFARVPYPVETAQARIRDAGLPAALGTRLAAGR